MATKYQTISEFMFAPFRKREAINKVEEYNKRYKEFISSNKIKLEGFCVIESSYYFHLTVPSESQKNNYRYDVVIRFFTDDPDIAKSTSLRSYYIQFFSNSPGFMYKYAYVYKKEGYLIQALYSKLDADYIDKAPQKTNPNEALGYDSSIYFACKYLSEKQFKFLQKNGVILMKKKNERNFFQSITDFKTVKFDQAIAKEEKDLAKLLKQEEETKKRRSSGKNTATTSTTHTITIVKKKKGKLKLPKITARKSTRK